MIKIEISSYPKSGNTWFRHIAQNFLTKLSGEDFYFPPDIHEGYEGVENHSGLFIPKINDQVLIYKSHIFNHPQIKPDRIIHIYRHPLDVFLSTRNYLFHESYKFSQDHLKVIFLNGKAKSVEEILKDNEMDYYFGEFLEQTGATYWAGMLGEKSMYFNYVLNAIELDNAISIRYEDLIENVSDTTNKAFNSIWSNIPFISINTEKVNKKTKDSGYKPFYWKSIARNYENFLTTEQINTFNQKYSKELSLLQY